MNYITKDKFWELLKSDSSDDAIRKVVRKYLLHGIPFVFDNRADDYFEFRSAIADKMNVRYHEVMVLGSGKLGYSYHKNNVFSQESDIDVAIVNEDLFDYYYELICKFQYQIDTSRKTFMVEDYQKYNKFVKYLIKGWMRPDLLPDQSFLSSEKWNWFEFFKSISYDNCLAGNYKVSAGLFKNFRYMERYYIESIKTANYANTYECKQ